MTLTPKRAGIPPPLKTKKLETDTPLGADGQRGSYAVKTHRSGRSHPVPGPRRWKLPPFLCIRSRGYTGLRQQGKELDPCTAQQNTDFMVNLLTQKSRRWSLDIQNQTQLLMDIPVTDTGDGGDLLSWCGPHTAWAASNVDDIMVL